MFVTVVPLQVKEGSDAFGVVSAGVKACGLEQPRSAGWCRMGRGEVVSASPAALPGDPCPVPVPAQWEPLPMAEPGLMWHWKCHSELADVVSLLKGGMESWKVI